MLVVQFIHPPFTLLVDKIERFYDLGPFNNLAVLGYLNTGSQLNKNYNLLPQYWFPDCLLSECSLGFWLFHCDPSCKGE